MCKNYNHPCKCCALIPHNTWVSWSADQICSGWRGTFELTVQVQSDGFQFKFRIGFLQVDDTFFGEPCHFGDECIANFWKLCRFPSHATQRTMMVTDH